MIYFFILNENIFGCAESLCRMWAFSRWSARASRRGVFSCGVPALGLVAVVRGLGCPAAGGVFPDQGLNLCSLRWQADF